MNETYKAGPSERYVEKGLHRPGKEMSSYKPKPIIRNSSVDIGVTPNSSNFFVSVKAKKRGARNRVALSNRSSTVEGSSIAGAPLPLNAQGRGLIDVQKISGERFRGFSSQDRCAIGADFGLGFQFGGGVDGEQGACSSDGGRDQQETDGYLERHPFSNGEECDGRRLTSPRTSIDGDEEDVLGFHGGLDEGGRDERAGLKCVDPDITNEVGSHAKVYASGGEAAVRDGDLDRMELEGGDEATPAC